jgi:chromosome segregation ATPase
VIKPKAIEPPVDGQAREEIAQLREELKTVSTRLEDYILTKERPQTDVTELLSELLDAYQELDRDIGHREWEDHADGTSLDELRNQREGLRARIQTLERWRQAHTPFGETAETPK